MGRYYDTTAVMQVLGGLYTNPDLLDASDKYKFDDECIDFKCEEFHHVIYGAIYNLHMLGATEMTPALIEDYLVQKPSKHAVFKLNNGVEYLNKIKNSAQTSAFDYYYNRLKKMTLLRMYHHGAGVSVKEYYDDDNILDLKKKQLQEEWLDNTPIYDIADTIDKKVSDIRLKYAENTGEDFIKIGSCIRNIRKKFQETPEYGYPLYGDIYNSVHRGARLGKLYIYSAPTGTGKTRFLVKDACTIGCSEKYDTRLGEWIKLGRPQPVLFIATEQDEEEISSLLLAFVSGVDEEKIITGRCTLDEELRLDRAEDILANSQIIIKKLPDFSLQDVENSVKYGIREYEVQYVFFDYIHSSMKILSEAGSRSGVSSLREDNVLFLMSARLKEICIKYKVFLATSTQLNGDFKGAAVLDQNVLRGSKAIADKTDFGSIMVDMTEKDYDEIMPLVEKMGVDTPNIKMSVYKNRRGKASGVLIWIKADKGTCTFEPLFVTNFRHEFVDLEILKVKLKEEEE